MSKSIVREALVTSVAWVRPLVRFHSSQESTVPNSSSPASALLCPYSTLSRSHRTLVAEK